MTNHSQSSDNCFCKVRLGETALKIILFLSEGDSLGHTLLKRCRDADYDCCLVHSESQVIENIERNCHQSVVVLDVDMPPLLFGNPSPPSSNLNHLSTFINLHGLKQNVGLIAIVQNLKPIQLIDELLLNGVSRVLTHEDCLGERLLLELKMMEKSEIAHKERQIFGLALYEAVEHSSDAIQVSGKNSKILYVNRAFLDISGYSMEEVLGKPAMDILKPFDTKMDNGPKAAVKKEQSWDGVCMGRRKSGSVLKHHLKFIPVHSSEDIVSHHVTIQRLLSAHDSEHSRLSNPRVNDFSFMLKKQPSLSKLYPRLESPLIKVVQMLNCARDNPNTPQKVKEALDKAVETLSNSELYTIPSLGKPSGGIVAGLLQSGGRYMPPKIDFNFMRMSQPHTHMSLLPSPVIQPLPTELQEALKDLDSWKFDIIKMETLSKNRVLYHVGMKVFSEFDLCSLLNIDVGIVSSWLKLMEEHYHCQNTYHNSTHAADVLQATAYFVKLLQDNLIQQGEILDRWEIAALMITAIIHDLDHPGRTNPYLCNTRHELAFLYNDNAVLENHHVAFSFKLTEQTNNVNIFQNLDQAMFRNLRTSIIEMVLATDMAKHFEHLTKFNVTLVDGESSSNSSLANKENSRESRMIMKNVLVKCADISNPCRPLPLCKIWAEKIAEEYFAQTDDEKLHKLPVVFPDFDRHTCRLPITQVKFIDYFVSGLFEAWNSFCPVPTVIDLLKSNYEYWKNQCPDSPNCSEEEAESGSKMVT